MKSYIFLLFILLSIGLNELAAQITITGTVYDQDGYGLPGVTVRVKGFSDIGTVTDIDGRYTLTRVPNDSSALVFSFVGMETLEVEIAGSSVVDANLNPADVAVDEVVVMALGIKRETKTLGYSATSISYDDAGYSRSERGKDRTSTSETSTAVDYGTEGSSTSTVTTKSYISTSGIASGQLTAGEVNDFSKWNLWTDITANEFADFQDYWKFYFSNRITVQVKNSDNLPVIGAEIDLYENEKIIWSSVSDNTGKAELWGNIFDNKDLKKTYLSVNYNGEKVNIKDIKKFSEGINFVELNADCNVPQNIDIAFVVDATGSMSDELEYLKAELSDVISRVKSTNEEMTYKLGSVFYRDYGDVYLTQESDFTENIDDAVSFIQKNYAGGGGDAPEAVDSGLEKAIENFNWSDDATAKILFLILDAPPHYSNDVITKIQNLTLSASSQGIRIVPIVCSGIDKQTEFLMRSIALATNGTYVFLTDDSGIGYSHIAPSTDEWEVETLNNLLIRIINQYSTAVSCEQYSDIMEENPDTLVVENKSELLNREISEMQKDSLLAFKTDSLESELSDNNNSEIEDDLFENEEISEIEEEILYTFKYYPNPTTGIFTIEIDGSIGEIFVTDVSGKIIQRYTVEGLDEIQVDITSFPAGFYFVRYFVDVDKFLDGKVVKY